jgi:phage gp36-like protein
MYATYQDMVDTYGVPELAALTAATSAVSGQPDQARIEKVLSRSSSEADSYIRSRYPVPLTTVPDVLTDKVCELTRYYLDRQPTESITDRWKAALAWLRDVRDGKIVLFDETNQVSAPESDMVTVAGSEPTFTTERLTGYV